MRPRYPIPPRPVESESLRICRFCGCNDLQACMTEEGLCCWVLLDIATPTGVCSACAAMVQWDAVALATAGLRP